MRMPSLSSATQSMDTVYPEPMSRLHRRVVPKKRRGGSFRYRTQPVTFSEIQEVDEDNIDEAIPEVSATSSSEQNLILNKKFEEFKRFSMKSDNNVDINKNPLSTSKSTSKLPAIRPLFSP